MLFTNAYERAIDAKQRLPIPAEIRAALVQEGQSEALYLVEGSNGGLWLWPQRTFERMAGDIEPSLAPPAEVIDFDEITFPYAPRLEIDTAGRVRIPQEMLEQAGIGAKVLILGMRDHLELWDPQTWHERHQEKSARRGEIIERAGPVLRERGRRPERSDQ